MRRAFSARVTISWMTPPDSMPEPLKLMIIPLGIPMNVWKLVDAITAPNVLSDDEQERGNVEEGHRVQCLP